MNNNKALLWYNKLPQEGLLLPTYKYLLHTELFIPFSFYPICKSHHIVLTIIFYNAILFYVRSGSDCSVKTKAEQVQTEIVVSCLAF